MKSMMVGVIFALSLTGVVPSAGAAEPKSQLPKQDAAKDPKTQLLKPDASKDAKPELPMQDPVADSASYRIGREDVLRIIVWKNESLSQTVAVRPDGRISVPLLGDVNAAGLTPTALREVLTAKLAEFVAAPEVSVVVTDVQSLKVSVIGEVPKPGRYDLKSRLTVLDMLAMAGGLGQLASRTRIVILRPNGDTLTRIPFNYNKAILPGGEGDNIFLQPGDIIVIP